MLPHDVQKASGGAEKLTVGSAPEAPPADGLQPHGAGSDSVHSALVELRERCDAVEARLAQRAGEVEDLERSLEQARREVLDSRAATTATAENAVAAQ